MTLDPRLLARRAEFEAHLWDHTADPFQQSFEARRPLDDAELKALAAVAQAICDGADDSTVSASLRPMIRENDSLMHVLMQQAGLTRNKILTDLRANTAAAGFRIPADAVHLTRTDEVWAAAGPYLASRLRKVFQPLCALSTQDGAFEAINQSTWPHWIRQERAKRQGHQAEYQIAVLLTALEIPFEPQTKADNPLSPDVQVHGVSFDIVSPDQYRPRMCVKSTVQTSNIGQFGESKGALEVAEAVEMLNSKFADPRPLLLAMVDGVGFRSNAAGLNGILSEADEFCQFASVWKGAVIAADVDGIDLTVALEPGHLTDHDEFLARYPRAQVLEVTPEIRSDPDVVEAGEALVFRRG